MEAMRRKMVQAVDLLSPDDWRRMVLRSLSMATTYEMTEMARATSFKSFEEMDFELDLTD
jgi:hypothetical protein